MYIKQINSNQNTKFVGGPWGVLWCICLWSCDTNRAEVTRSRPEGALELEQEDRVNLSWAESYCWDIPNRLLYKINTCLLLYKSSVVPQLTFVHITYLTCSFCSKTLRCTDSILMSFSKTACLPIFYGGLSQWWLSGHAKRINQKVQTSFWKIYYHLPLQKVHCITKLALNRFSLEDF